MSKSHNSTRGSRSHGSPTAAEPHSSARLQMAALAVAALVACGGTLAGAARAASLPGASTAAATQVGFDTATLNGTVDPKGSETFYYFQYGPTRAYGLQTPVQQAGAGTTNLRVSLGVTGLLPITPYHFRLVAVNGQGAAAGGDRSFLTGRVPLSLAILSSPDPVPFGGAVTVQGTLSGTGNGNREVVLQANAFPFTAGFVNVGNPELTSPTGGFVFTVLGLAATTQYRVVTTTNPAVISPVSTEEVALRISPHVRRLRGAIVGGRRLVRFWGTVAPAMDHAQVGVMRLVHGHNVFVAGMALRHLSATSSRFERILRVRRGIYRILVLTKNPALVSTYSAPMVVR